MKFYIADTHFFHGNMIKYENRPFKDVEEMNETIVANWNRKVAENDEIYILGDFAFCNGDKVNELLDRLNGKKYLITGNHDSFMKYKEFDRSKFVSIRDIMKVSDNKTKIVLCHYPIAVWESQHHGSLHFYGHIHKLGFDRFPDYAHKENSYNVGADLTGFEPVTLDEILANYKTWMSK